MEQNFGNQPDFAIAAHALQTAGNELAKCPNLPAIQGGNAILTAIQNMETRITARMQTLSDQQQALSVQMLALTHNNFAQLQNRMLHSSTDPLAPLHDRQNNPVELFPATPAALQALRGPQLESILQALGVPHNGTVEQKRSRLRLIAGLRADVILA